MSNRPQNILEMTAEEYLARYYRHLAEWEAELKARPLQYALWRIGMLSRWITGRGKFRWTLTGRALEAAIERIAELEARILEITKERDWFRSRLHEMLTKEARAELQALDNEQQGKQEENRG
jgi:hypothetical protein